MVRPQTGEASVDCNGGRRGCTSDCRHWSPQRIGDEEEWERARRWEARHGEERDIEVVQHSVTGGGGRRLSAETETILSYVVFI